MIGEVILFAAATPPAGFLGCDGSAVSRTTYSALFAVVSTIYGIGDGVTTFNLPDLRGRFVVGAGSGTGLTPRVLGATGGEETHVLTNNELASHSHAERATGEILRETEGSGSGGKMIEWRESLSAEETVEYTAPSGSNAAHNTVPPFLCLLACIQYSEVDLESLSSSLDANFADLISALTEA